MNPEQLGTKAAAHYALEIASGGSATVRLRLSDRAPDARRGRVFGRPFDEMLASRRSDADIFYASVIPSNVDDDSADVMRQALAGMLWTNSSTPTMSGVGSPSMARISSARRPLTVVRRRETANGSTSSTPTSSACPTSGSTRGTRHGISPFTRCRSRCRPRIREGAAGRCSPASDNVHPNGQFPGLRVELRRRESAGARVGDAVHLQHGTRDDRQADREFLKRVFDKLLLNFTWWVNRKDREGRNVFEGGFLGLDNVGVFDRSAPLPTGGFLEQADGTAWMAFFAQTMFRSRSSSPRTNRRTRSSRSSSSNTSSGSPRRWTTSAIDDDMWDEQDGFFYDLLRLPDGRCQRLKVRSVVGLLPLCASTVIEPRTLAGIERLKSRLGWVVRRPEYETAGGFIQNVEQTRRQVRFKNTKSGKARTVAISATALQELRQHKTSQAEGLLRLGIRQDDDTLVCTLPDGSMLRPNTLTIYWRDGYEARPAAHPLPRPPPRMRYPHAGLGGASENREWLGHSRVAVTLDLYSHVMPGMQEEAAARVDDALRIAMQSGTKGNG